MIKAVMAALAIFLILVISESLWRKKLIHGELARKMVHILVGSFVAAWPFFMPIKSVEYISLALIAGVVISRQFNIFRTIQSLGRRGGGDVLFAVGIGLAALLSVNKWIFAAAILHMSLADGLAAAIGSLADAKGKGVYRFFGETRTLLGTAVFWLVSIGILVWVTTVAGTGLHGARHVLLWLPLTTALLENVSILGLDNVTVPIYIAVILGLLVR